MSLSPRLLAVQALGQVLPSQGNGRSLRDVLSSQRSELEAADRGLMTDLCFGVCRHLRLLEHWLDRQMQKPLKPSARNVRLALLCGLYEVWFTPRARHAVLNAWPDVMRQLKAPWAAGLTNALLRKATREDLPAWQATLPVPLACSLPDWLWSALQRDWGCQAEELARIALSPPPLTLRVNRAQSTREQALARLDEAGIDAIAHAELPWAVTLREAVPVQRLPGFDTGLWSVQDASAQLPAEWIEAPPHGRLLDACAAPGGKTGQLAERFADATLVALDNDPQRLQRVQDNLSRLGARATLLAGDATDPDRWWDGQPFDAVLLDAPCSATGILRRQPDLKWHRKPGDLDALCGLQARMLDAIWPLVRPGGMLVYATCSVLDRENSDQVQAFLARTADARDDTPAGTSHRPVPVGAQRAPRDSADAPADGFYVARLRKAP